VLRRCGIERVSCPNTARPEALLTLVEFRQVRGEPG
jgi:hypothetical protein